MFISIRLIRESRHGVARVCGPFGEKMMMLLLVRLFLGAIS
jgi:hypothetical protein